MGILSALRAHYRVAHLLASSQASKPLKADAPSLTLSFLNYGLGRLPVSAMSAILASAGPEARCLNLTNNSLYLKTGAELGCFFKQINPNVNIFQLNQNRLGALGKELGTAVAEIPDSVSELDLTWNDLGDLGDLGRTGLAGILTAVRSPIRKLKLGSNNLKKIGPDAMGLAMASLHRDLESIDLSNNQLNAEQLIAAITNMPKGLRKLNIAGNDLGTFSAGDLGSVFAAAKSIKSMDLRGNNLGAIPVSDLVKAFSSLPSDLEELGLADNEFSLMSDEDFAAVMSALPKGLKAIQLRHNLLTPKARRAIPASITRIDERSDDGDGMIGDGYGSINGEIYRSGSHNTLSKVLKDAAKSSPPPPEIKPLF